MVLEVPSHLADPQLQLGLLLRLLCLMHALLWKGCREKPASRAATAWTFSSRRIVTVLHAGFPSLLISSQTSPLSHYNLFSLLMFYTQLFCPFLPWPLFMQIISVAFLYLFSWYLPSLLHAKLISGSPCLFIEPVDRDLCVFSSLFAPWHLCPLALLSISLIITKWETDDLRDNLPAE